MDAVVFYITLVTGFRNLIFLGINIQQLLTILIGLQVVDMILKHTNIKTRLAKIKRGIRVFIQETDDFILRIVDNRDK